MFENMEQIVLSGLAYPIKCDLVVLEQLQDMFGSIEEFEEGLIDWEYVLDDDGKRVKKKPEKEGQEEEYETKYKFPKVKNVVAATFFMVNEGMEIAGKEPPFKTMKDAARAIDAPAFRVSRPLHMEFFRSITRKNVNATQVEK